MLMTIMKMESGGNPNAINHNSNGTDDLGIMQINTADAQEYGYDVNRLRTDPTYNIWAAADTLKRKTQMLKRIGEPVTPENLFHAYNGWSPQGQKYADKAMDIYQSL